MWEIENALRCGGHEIVGLSEAPDLCVVNTCTVTAKSDYQSRQLIRRASRAGARVIVTGCYSELNRERVSSIKGVEKVFSNSQKGLIINQIAPDIKSNGLHIKTGSRTRFTLKVQDGCDRACSYCLVWKARGDVRSIPIEEAAARAVEAEKAGYREIVLSGVHLGLYGKDQTGGADLAVVAGLLPIVLNDAEHGVVDGLRRVVGVHARLLLHTLHGLQLRHQLLLLSPPHVERVL